MNAGQCKMPLTIGFCTLHRRKVPFEGHYHEHSSCNGLTALRIDNGPLDGLGANNFFLRSCTVQRERLRPIGSPSPNDPSPAKR